ncbi:MAG TPA: hypothetical protein VGG01_00465 [Xanthobacteraceae bacterium]|jgi:hypothetical protein
MYRIAPVLISSAASPDGVRNVLQAQSHNVAMYLTWAEKARNRARHATLKSERAFYQRMEQRWTDLAASTASAERVDLFLLTVKDPVLPLDTCSTCHGVMATEVLEATGSREIYTLRCRHCGGTEWRTVLRYTMRDRMPPGVDAAAATQAPHAPRPA